MSLLTVSRLIVTGSALKRSPWLLQGLRGVQFRSAVACASIFRTRYGDGGRICLVSKIYGKSNVTKYQPFCSKAPDKEKGLVEPIEEPAKLGLFARFKKMYKEYWYVLVPVHCVTSAFWLGGFYYASKSGVDVIALLESMGVSEKLINPVRDSSLGHIAVAYLLYKIATPARYAVTLGGTTVSIKYLVQWGYIKPMPTKAALVQMYKDQKENLQERIAEKKQDFQDRKQQLEERKKSLMDDYQQYKSGTKSIKDKKEDVRTESK
ncbi:uncharacterized protein C18orf19 homolog A [Wyeomyia smithii]|uniref:uncharacterized protein C18orf19 homolog A n=1 Tax=Wyeomyia smithii TaxID=174621 RepID=UPI002467B237|nr:uncharacterized protein C18orf19 homolog A [Wyeomyia smithii]